jgi:hypothetical protein
VLRLDLADDRVGRVHECEPAIGRDDQRCPPILWIALAADVSEPLEVVEDRADGLLASAR